MNQLITRSADGKWSIDAQSPILSEWQEKYVDVTRSRGIITKPAGLAARLCGGKELEEAVKRNEVWKVGDLYQWSEYQEHELEGHRGSMQASGIRKLGLQQFNEINKQLPNNDNNLNLSGSERTTLDNTALADPRPVPDKITANLAKVQHACDKAIMDGGALLEKVKYHMCPFGEPDYAIYSLLFKSIEAPHLLSFFAGVCGPSGCAYGIWTSMVDPKWDPR